MFYCSYDIYYIVMCFLFVEKDLSDGTQSTLVTLIVFAGAAVMPALLRHAGITSWGVPTLAGIAHWTVTVSHLRSRFCVLNL